LTKHLIEKKSTCSSWKWGQWSGPAQGDPN